MSMNHPSSDPTPTERRWIDAGCVTELQRRGHLVIRAADRPVVVFYNAGDVRAVDNRCPHMGFPLHRGTCENGMITCHWHHARFDAHSGCTFDLFADDVPAYDVELRDGRIFVADMPRQRDPVNYPLRRLRDGMEQNISLISAKAILALRAANVPAARIVREAALFGVDHRDDWSMGLTVLTAMSNLLDQLGQDTAYLALYQGVRRVAADAAGQPRRRRNQPLEANDLGLDTLQRWLGYWTTVRHRDGAERTLLTAVTHGASPQELTRLVFLAASQRYYADGGHLLDFCNKAFELLDIIGHEHADRVLPAIVGQLVSARGGEELNAWRHPIDLVPLIQQAADRLPGCFEAGQGKTWAGEADLAEALLGEEPGVNLKAITDAVAHGAKPRQLTKALAYAAAMRVARFGTANEIGDWITALHTFSYCNALHQTIIRCDDPQLVPAVLHGAMAIYLDRFLNVPPAKLPGQGRGLTLDDLSDDAQELLEGLLDALDQQQRVDLAARLTVRYLRLGHPVSALIDVLVQAAVREDANFHTLQMVEAAVRQFHEWGPSEQGIHILTAAARYLAAHSPTQRAQLQTARIALRLHRGEKVFEEDDEDRGS